MTQIHLVLRRISPALKIDFVQIGSISNDQFKPLPLSAFADSDIAPFIKTGPISDTPFINHSDVSDLIVKLSSSPGFMFEFFDNTVVLMFDLNINHNEITSKEEREGN